MSGLPGAARIGYPGAFMPRALLLSSLLVLAVPACGGDDTVVVIPDAGAADGGSDAPVADAASSAVAVIALDGDGQPDQGIVLLVHDGPGRLVDRTTTDQLGLAALEVPPGGRVTAVQRAGERRVITSVIGVQPGDELLFGAVADVPVQQSFTFGGPRHPDAAAYRFLSSCGRAVDRADPTTVLMFREACTSELVQLVVVPLSATGAPLGHVHGIVERTAGAGATGDAYEPVGHLALTVLGAATIDVAAITPVGHEARIPLAARGPAGAVIDVPLVGAGTGVSLVADDGSARLARRFAAVPAAASLDLTAAPALGAVLRDGDVIRWANRDPGAGDGLVATLGSTEVSWSMVMPADSVSLTMPELPADLADLAPLGDGSQPPVVRWFELSWVSGWDGFRRGGHRDAGRAERVVAGRLEDASALIGRSP